MRFALIPLMLVAAALAFSYPALSDAPLHDGKVIQACDMDQMAPVAPAPHVAVVDSSDPYGEIQEHVSPCDLSSEDFFGQSGTMSNLRPFTGVPSDAHLRKPIWFANVGYIPASTGLGTSRLDH